MGEKYRNRYRIESTRMENWDYAWHGWYFITIITHGREHYFGDVIDGKMILSDLGKIVQSEWLKTPEIRPDMNLVLDEFIVMPNHFHGIIQIGKNDYNQFDNGDIVAYNGCNDAMHGVSTAETGTTTESLQIKNQFAPQRKNLASIIRGFKSAVTTVARKKNIDFGWQPRFYDQIIRDKKSLYIIRRYIKENPASWSGDELNSRARY